MRTKVLLVLTFLFSLIPLQGQVIETIGQPVSGVVESMTVKGLNYLSGSQSDDGSWSGGYGSNPGVVGLAVLSMLAHGDDPNFGIYSSNISKGIGYILKNQNSSSGYIGSSMYNHGFATLALAESYGVVDDERIGPALEKAVNLILSSQKRNPKKAWRYSPTDSTADTTVSGACLVALLAAANAGVAIPGEAIKDALRFYASCQDESGGIGYVSRGGPNVVRTSIGVLGYALARQKKRQEYAKAYRYVEAHGGADGSRNYFFYNLYYTSQAVFHSSSEMWHRWNAQNIKTLKAMQKPDGSWSGSHGDAFATSAALLSMALNYRFLPIYER